MEDDDLLGEEQDLRQQLQQGARIMGDGSRGRRFDGPGNRSAAIRDQERVQFGKGAMGNRPNASSFPPCEWNKGQGGRFHDQQSSHQETARFQPAQNERNQGQGGRFLV